MKKLLGVLPFILHLLGAAHADNLKPIAKLIAAQDFRTASAEISLRLALNSQLTASERLRYALLKAALESARGNFEAAHAWLAQAHKLHYARFPDRHDLLAEIEMSEFDVRAEEGP